jgi:hypothetical protein
MASLVAGVEAIGSTTIVGYAMEKYEITNNTGTR